MVYRNWLMLIFLGCATNAVAKWQCPSVDKSGQFYVISSPFIKMSIYKSLDLCKKKSRSPETCMVERAFCQRSEGHVSLHTYWQCFAYDKDSKKYQSGPYGNKYQAAMAAESHCKYLSRTPHSCYVQLFTCESI